MKIIILGAGQVGGTLAEHLASEANDITVVDTDGDPEKFGTCHQCGADIGFDRLDALPHARLCISCKEKEEDAKRR